MQPVEELNKALGHLVKAKEGLGESLESARIYRANRDAEMASHFVRFALKQLELFEQEKEETC